MELTPTEIRLNDDGSLDEVVAWGFAHLEQMSNQEWILLIDTTDGKHIRIPIFSKNMKSHVVAFAEEDGPSESATWIAHLKAREELKMWEVASKGILSLCEVCWSTSWTPIESETDCALIHPHHNPDQEHVRCELCWTHTLCMTLQKQEEAFRQALAAAEPYVANFPGGAKGIDTARDAALERIRSVLKRKE